MLISEIVARGHIDDLILLEALRVVLSCESLLVNNNNGATAGWINLALNECRGVGNPSTALAVFRALRKLDHAVVDEAEYIHW